MSASCRRTSWTCRSTILQQGHEEHTGGWIKNDPSKATPVFGKETGACGVANAGNPVSEMSVQYNDSLEKYVVLYGDQFNTS